MDYSLSEQDIRRIINSQTKAKYIIKPYSYINQFTKITDLMDGIDAIVILYFTEKDYGHWTCLTKSDTPEYKDYIEHQYKQGRPTKYVLCFFDSLGLLVDKELSFVPPDIQRMRNEEFPHLRELLKNADHFVEWNNWKLQREVDGVSTCGRYCAQRVVDRNVPLKPWVDQFLHKSQKPDTIIVNMTARFLRPVMKEGMMYALGGARKKKVSAKSRSSSKAKAKSSSKTAIINKNVINILGERAPEPKKRGTRRIRYQNERASDYDPTVKVERGPLQRVRRDTVFHPTVSLPSQVHYVNTGNTAAANALAALSNQVSQLSQSTRDLYTRNRSEGDFLRQAERTHVNDVLYRQEAEGRMLGTARAAGQNIGIGRPHPRRRAPAVGGLTLDTTTYGPDDHVGGPYLPMENPPPQPYESGGIAINPTTVVEHPVDLGIEEATLPREPPVRAVQEPFRQRGDRFVRPVHVLPASQMRGRTLDRVEEVETEVPPEPPAYDPPRPRSRIRIVEGTHADGDRVFPLDPFVLLGHPEGHMRGVHRVEVHRRRPVDAEDDEQDYEEEAERYAISRGIKPAKEFEALSGTSVTRARTGALGARSSTVLPPREDDYARELSREYLENPEGEDYRGYGENEEGQAMDLLEQE